MGNLYRMFVHPKGVDGEHGADLMEQLGDEMAKEVVGHLKLHPTDGVLEIGFGPGIGLQILSQCLPLGHVSGVDPSALMHRRATNRNLAAIREGRMKLFEGTADGLPFVNASFDAAMAMDNLHFWPDRMAGLRELRRVLKPGSRFICSFSPPSGGSIVGLAENAVDAGFRDISEVKCSKGVAIFCRVPF